MADIESSDFAKAIAKIIAAAWEDEEFKNELLAADADRERLRAALDRYNDRTKQNLKLPEVPGAPKGTVLRFVANTPEVRNVVIPLKPHFTDADLQKIVKERQLFSQFSECFDDEGGDD